MESGSPSRVPCRRCGTAVGAPCGDDGRRWLYCAERIADVRALLVRETKPRVITQQAGELLVDGEPVRSIEPGANAYYQRRGGNAHHQGRRRK